MNSTNSTLPPYDSGSSASTVSGQSWLFQVNRVAANPQMWAPVAICIVGLAVFGFLFYMAKLLFKETLSHIISISDYSPNQIQQIKSTCHHFIKCRLFFLLLLGLSLTACESWSQFVHLTILLGIMVFYLLVQIFDVAWFLRSDWTSAFARFAINLCFFIIAAIGNLDNGSNNSEDNSSSASNFFALLLIVIYMWLDYAHNSITTKHVYWGLSSSKTNYGIDSKQSGPEVATVLFLCISQILWIFALAYWNHLSEDRNIHQADFILFGTWSACLLPYLFRLLHYYHNYDPNVEGRSHQNLFVFPWFNQSQSLIFCEIMLLNLFSYGIYQNHITLYVFAIFAFVLMLVIHRGRRMLHTCKFWCDFGLQVPIEDPDHPGHIHLGLINVWTEMTFPNNNKLDINHIEQHEIRPMNSSEDSHMIQEVSANQVQSEFSAQNQHRSDQIQIVQLDQQSESKTNQSQNGDPSLAPRPDLYIHWKSLVQNPNTQLYKVIHFHFSDCVCILPRIPNYERLWPRCMCLKNNYYDDE